MKFAIIVFVSGQFSILAAVLAQANLALPAPSSSISVGALMGLLATWIGLVIGYLNLRRSLKADMRVDMIQIAKECSAAEVTKRAATFMDSALQVEINKNADGRYTSLERRIDQIEGRQPR